MKQEVQITSPTPPDRWDERYHKYMEYTVKARVSTKHSVDKEALSVSIKEWKFASNPNSDGSISVVTTFIVEWEN